MTLATTTSSAARVLSLALGLALGLALLGATPVLISPARAESPGECQGMFQSADLNGDGLLSGAEIAASDDIGGDLATAIGDQVSLPEFMAACSD